jgi:hypothetical protein
MYLDDYGTSGAAKRAMYVMIRHAQIALDVIVEDDMTDGTIDEYALIFLNAAHITQAAGAKLVTWVDDGGLLFGSVVSVFIWDMGFPS